MRCAAHERYYYGLWDSGELDVYSTCREEFQRAAALFAPAADIFADADGDEDMFGDDFAAAKQVPGTPPLWSVPLLSRVLFMCVVGCA